MTNMGVEPDESCKDKDDNEATPKNRKKTVIIGAVGAVVLVVAVALFVFLYFLPYSEAKGEYDAALEQFNAEVTALEERNSEFDDSIERLSQVVSAEGLPIDELLLSVAQDVIKEGQEHPKDSAPAAPEPTLSIEGVRSATSDLRDLTKSVSEMGDYDDILTKVNDTETEFRSMIANFSTANAEVIWVNVDQENTVLRFVAKLSNPNNYTLRDVSVEWTALDAQGAIVGSHSGSQPDIPANGFVYYVGGAGSTNLSGTPANVELKVTADGLLTNREAPVISVENVQLVDNGFSWYTVTAICLTDTEIKSSQVDGQFIVKDASGNIIGADFWSADNLPDTIEANGRFGASMDYFDLPTIPQSAEAYMYYRWD